jgi:hypothetical protein
MWSPKGRRREQKSAQGKNEMVENTHPITGKPHWIRFVSASTPPYETLLQLFRRQFRKLDRSFPLLLRLQLARFTVEADDEGTDIDIDPTGLHSQKAEREYQHQDSRWPWMAQ